MNRKSLSIGLALLGLTAVAIAAITVQRVVVSAVASDGTGQFQMNLQAIKIYHDDYGARLLGRGSFALTRGTQRVSLQLRQLTAMNVFELEEGGYQVTLEGTARFAPNIFVNRNARPESGTFRLVILDLPAEGEGNDSVEFRFVGERGRRLDFFGEVTGGTLQVSEQTM